MYTAQENHWFAKGVGFLLVPSLAYRATPSHSKRSNALLGQGASAVVAWQLSEQMQSQELQGFARGAMWGNVVLAALMVFRK